MSRRKAARSLSESLESRVLFSIARPDHIVIVIENHRFSNAVGDTAHLPYLNQLAASGLVYTNSHGVGKVNEFIPLYAGSTLGVTDNGNHHTFTDPNLGKLLNSKQVSPGQFLSFGGFAESLPHDGDSTTRLAPDPNIPNSAPDVYIRTYNPMAQFTDAGSRNGVAIANSVVNKTFNAFPTTAAGFAALPTVSYVIPDTNHGTHGSNEQDPYATDPANYNMFRSNADAWLLAKMKAYADWAKANNSLIIVTQDEEESDYFIRDTITTVVNGDPRLFVPGTNSTYINHYNLLRTIEDMYGLSYLGETGSATDFTTNAAGQLSPFPSAVTQTATNTNLVSSVASPVFGQNVTFTATVAGTSGVPTGLVTFKDGSTVLGSGALNASGVANFSTALLTTAAHSITAIYGGDAANLGSTSAILSTTVSRASTSLALIGSSATSTFGQSLTFTATVSVLSPGAGVPSGTITFSDGSTMLGTLAVNSSRQAALSIASLGVGGHSITAVYNGDTNNVASASDAVAAQVNTSATATAVTAPANGVYGQSIAFSATVAPVAPGGGTPSGFVQFVIDDVNVGSPVALSNGIALLPAINSLALGSHSVVALYDGDVNFVGSTSATATIVLAPANTGTTVTSNANPATVGQAVTFTATVGVIAPGAGAPTGTIQFVLDGVNFGLPVALVNNTAVSDPINSLVAGAHTIAAIYSGDVNFNASTSANFVQSIGLTNDRFANATLISGAASALIGSNAGATKETGEPNHAGNAGGKSVWWTWTAPSAGTVTIDTAGSDFDTLLAVYTGTAVNALTSVASNNDVAVGTKTSKVSFAVTAGKVYRIAVDGLNGASGNIALNLNLVPPAPGVPTAVNASDGTFTDGVHVTWTAPVNAVAYEVWRNTTNASGSAAKITVSDVATTSYIDTTAVAGKTYYYWVKAKNTGGTSGFSASNSGFRSVVAPPNDLFSNRIALTGPTATATVNNAGATKETGEPKHAADAGGKSVWYSYTATANGTLTIDTFGSSFDTTLAIYTGSSVSALTLTPNGSNDDIVGQNHNSAVTIAVKAGTTYQIAVDGFSGASGDIVLHLKVT